MLKEIRLYGHLGKKFGRVHYLAVQSVSEAIKAFCANYKEFEKDFIGDKAYYRVWVGTERLKEAKDATLPSSYKEVIRIAPVVHGAGGDELFGIILGAVLIYVTAGAAGASILAGWGAAPGVVSFVQAVGISLVMGGIAAMLAPSVDAPDPQERPENKPSQVFNGPVNTIAQGQPVPIGYGRLIVGSAVISAGIKTVELI